MKNPSTRPHAHRHGVSAGKDLPLPVPAEYAFARSLNPAMQEIGATLRRVAASHVNVLLVGENGTGKEWAAHIIHRTSPRGAGRLVTVECSSLTPEELEREVFGYESVQWKEIDIRPGALERANDGTLLLNEIGHIPPALLMRMLRAVEFQVVRRIAGADDVTLNVRLISTMTLAPSGAQGRTGMPDGLLHRLSPIQIELPPLRRRREDIPMLVEAFLADIGGREGAISRRFSYDALNMCMQFDWPGNLRHLRNAVEYAAVMSPGPAILPEHLPPYLTGAGQSG